MYCRKRDAIASELERVKSCRVNPGLVGTEDAERVLGVPLDREYSLEELLRRPGVTYHGLMTLQGAGAPAQDSAVAEQIEISTKYAGYIEKQKQEISRRAEKESQRLPIDLDYRSVRGLSNEVQQKLNEHRPETIGQASRISGITPAAIALLLVHLKRGFKPAAPNADKLSA